MFRKIKNTLQNVNSSYVYVLDTGIFILFISSRFF